MSVANYPENPEHLWRIFYDFTQTPRPSKYEDKIINYLINIAKENNLKFVQDKAKNVIVYVPGTSGRQNEDPLIIQNHIDMVTDAIQGLSFNFKEDPLDLEVVDGWLKAKGTTLGADNGIGCAAALALIFDTNVSHPPLELLFTVDEETGLNGALGLEAKNFKAKRMLNLDTEEWGSFYIGCAGGIDYDFNREYSFNQKTLSNSFEIKIDGFIGGHSGLNIIDQRANAIKVVTHILTEIGEVELVELRFGKAHNIIPRDGFVKFYTNSSKGEISSILRRLEKEYKGFLPEEDHLFNFTINDYDENHDCLNINDSQQFLSFLELFPHGVRAMDTKDIVSCSNNLARALLVRGKAYVLTSIRFFDRNEAKSIEREVIRLSRLLEFKWEYNSEYPSWKPVRENSLLDKLVETYEDIYGKKPEITAIHAGLECGILKDKLGEMDVCSFGPTIEGAHSPDEKVNIKSVEYFWNLLKSTLKNI